MKSWRRRNFFIKKKELENIVSFKSDMLLVENESLKQKGITLDEYCKSATLLEKLFIVGEVVDGFVRYRKRIGKSFFFNLRTTNIVILSWKDGTKTALLIDIDNESKKTVKYDNEHAKYYSFSLIKRINEKNNVKIETLVSDEGLCFSLAICLFELIFGVHPYIGEQFFKNDYFKDEVGYIKFIKDKFPNFIFDTSQENKENIFVNGYSNVAFELWRNLPEPIQQFFLKAFNEEFLGYEEMLEFWENEVCLLSNVKKAFYICECGVDFDIYCSKKYGCTIFATSICGEAIMCTNISKKCTDCDLKEKEQWFPNKLLTVFDNGIDVSSRYVWDGEKIFGADIGIIEDVSMEIVLSKKHRNLLGIKILDNLIWTVKDKIYAKGEVIPLISINSEILVSEKYKIQVK